MRTCEEHRNVVVVYETNYCPLCETETERDEATTKLSDADSEIDNLKDQLHSVKCDVSDLETLLRNEQRNHDH